MLASPGLKPDGSASTTSFRLKGGLFPLTLLELIDTDIQQLRQELAQKMAEAPTFFQQSPTVLSLEQLQQPIQPGELRLIRDLCLEYGLIIVALRGANDQLQSDALAMNLALISAPKERKTEPATCTKTDRVTTPSESDQAPENDDATQAESAEQAVAAPQPGAQSKIITTPVRSGQQVYAPGGDLIILAAVSAGAEVLAEGSIHVYAPARGRILAGVKGNQSARIFCQSLEAELVSIAGYFKVNEDLRETHWKQSVQAYLTGETLNIDRLS